jgi:ferredoxin-NADP reductase
MSSGASGRRQAVASESVPDGPVRQYSLCNDPAESHRYLIGVLRVPDSRGGSVAMHARVREGDALRISEPKNHFPLAHGARHSLLVAGGIGVTPILCDHRDVYFTDEEHTRNDQFTPCCSRSKTAELVLDL